MPAARKSYRVPEATLAKIAELAERWGGISPVSETAVFIEAIDRAYLAEFGGPKITKVKPKAKS